MTEVKYNANVTRNREYKERERFIRDKKKLETLEFKSEVK